MKFQIERLKRLNRRANETWQGGLVRLPVWVDGQNDQKPCRPWVAGWVSLKTKLFHMTQLQRPQDMNFEVVLNCLVDFACNTKLAGYRPAKIEIKNPDLAGYLAGMLAEADIALEVRNKLFAFDEIIEKMAGDMFEQPLVPDALDSKGVTIELMRSFADSACRFYQACPWDQLSSDDPIEIESPFVDASLRFCSVLGEGGETFGLGFYDSYEQFASLRDGDGTGFLGSGKHWSVLFGPITDLPFGDVDLWQDHDFPVAGDEGYPLAMCWFPEGKARRPGPDILAFFEGLMRALAEATEQQLDSARWQKKVMTARGPIQFTLALPELLVREQEGEVKPLKTTRGMPDMRSMERLTFDMHRALEQHDFKDIEEAKKFLNENFVGANPPSAPTRTPMEKAQELAYQAFEARGRMQKQLAKKALAVWPDCADAYVVMAERCSDTDKAVELYRRGVEAGRRALGEQMFKEKAGNFWGILKTRPYMRAGFGLAQCLEIMGQTDEAIEHYRELLRLNPNDNQGVRDSLLNCLLEKNRNEEASNLLKRYKDDKYRAQWCYARALVTFRQKGDTTTARRHLREAIDVNDQVLEYLLGDAELPPVCPSSYAIGSDDEAVICAGEMINAWTETPGAIEWLERRA